jgi:hypothetical protein
MRRTAPQDFSFSARDRAGLAACVSAALCARGYLRTQLMYIDRIKSVAAALALACALLAAPGVAASAPRPAYDCEGNACSQVTVTWEDEGQRFRVENNSDTKVKVEVTTYAGTSSVRVEPHKSDYLGVKYFNGPYRADFE